MPDDPPSPALKPMPSRLGIGFNVVLQVGLGIAICLGINFLSFRNYSRWDLSPSGGFTLSSSTENFLRKLSKDVEITVLISRGSNLYSEVQALTDEYRRNGKNLIKVEFVDPSRDLERAEQIKLENKITLQTSGILVKANKGLRFLPENDLVVQSPGMDADHPTLDFRGEDAVTSAIVGLIEGTHRTFYFISGKGSRAEAGGNNETLNLLKELGRQQNFEVLGLNLSEVTTIPADANGLLFVGPKYDLSERELALLQAYWSQKRAAALFLLDPAAETPRLDGFLRANGVSPRGDRVLYAESTSAGPKKVLSVETGFARESPITRPVQDATTTLAGQTQSLEISASEGGLRELGLEVKPLMIASPRYWGEQSYLDDLPVAGEGDAKPPLHLAASVERGAVQDERLRVDSARLVVVGNATLLDPQTRVAENQDFLAASLNWMLNRERLIGITPKRKHQYRVQLTDRQRDLLFWITALCAPAVVLGIGFSVWAKRRAT